MRSELDLQIDEYLRDPPDFPAEFMAWIRRLIEDVDDDLFLQRTAAAGTGVNGIDFNKENDHDALGAPADYLWLSYIGTPLPYSTYGGGGKSYGPLNFFNNDTGTGGGFVTVQNSNGGVVGWHSTADGGNLSDGGTTFWPDKTKFDVLVDGSLHSLTNEFMWSDGKGALYFRQVGTGPIIFELSNGPYHVHAGGKDKNFVAAKFSVKGNDFLVQGDQTTTRDGSGNITAVTPTNQAFRVTPGTTTGIWMYSLPTSSAGLTTGQVWNSSGVLHIV